MPVELASLPMETLHQVLTYLPIPSLLAFGQTSRFHHDLQQIAFTRLRIGVFPTRPSALLSHLESSGSSACCGNHQWETEVLSAYDAERAGSIQVTLKHGKQASREAVVRRQNRIIGTAVQKHGATLRALEVALWELDDDCADLIAKSAGGGGSQLRHLAIRLDHPHARHYDLGPLYWKKAPASTVWNAFYLPTGRTPSPSPPASPVTKEGGEPLQAAVTRLMARPLPSRSPSPEIVPGNWLSPRRRQPASMFPRLESLTLERAGITDYQLSRIIAASADTLRKLRLRKCINLTAEFWRWLSAHRVASRLRVLHFTHARQAEIDERILPYVASFADLQSFSLLGCANISDEEVVLLNKDTWQFAECVPPGCGGAIAPELQVEVDPAYK